MSPSEDVDKCDGLSAAYGAPPDLEERVVSFGFRKSVRLGPLRLTASSRGVTASTGLGPLRVSRSSRGRRTTVRVPG